MMTFRTRKSCFTLIVRVVLLLTLLGGVVSAKYSPLRELQEVGFYGRVHAWGGVTRKAHNVEIKMPSNAPIIISDYHSPVGANGLRRNGMHRGVDIFEETGSPVIAAADGRVVRAKVDKCWGPTILIRHGNDKFGRKLYALYGHVKNIAVKVGEKVKRGQQIAEIGKDIFTSCGAGFHHLHFQISHNPRKVPLLGWGWANFVMDGFSAPNPHNYWEDGKGKVTCFEEGRKYSSSGLTYPVPCKNETRPKTSEETIFALQSPIEQLLNQKGDSQFLFGEEVQNLEELPDSAELDEATMAVLLEATEVLDAEEAVVQLESEMQFALKELDDVVLKDTEKGEIIHETQTQYALNDEHAAEVETAEPLDNNLTTMEQEWAEQDFISSGLRYLDLTASQSASKLP